MEYFWDSTPAQKVGGSSRHCILRGKGESCTWRQNAQCPCWRKGFRTWKPKGREPLSMPCHPSNTWKFCNTHLEGLGSCSMGGLEQMENGCPQPSLISICVLPPAWTQLPGEGFQIFQSKGWRLRVTHRGSSLQQPAVSIKQKEQV